MKKTTVLLALLAASSTAFAQKPAATPAPVAAPAPAPAAAPAAAPAPAPLPYAAIVPLVPGAGVKAPQQHVGALVAVALEQVLLAHAGVNVVTQGAQAEVMEDLGRKPGEPLDEASAKRLAQLTGASTVVFGAFEAGEKGAVTCALKAYGVLGGKVKDLLSTSGTPAEVADRAAAALATELGVSGLGAAVVPAAAKAQQGYVACASWAAVALERVAVKGRKAAAPKAISAACKDAASDKAAPLGAGAQLAVKVLTGDGKAVAELDKHAAANPADRTASLALVRAYFEAEKYDEADAVLKRLKAARPRDPDVLRLVGELAIQRDDWDAARFAFAQATNEAPNSPYLRYRLSYAAYRTDKPNDALEHARQALRLAGGEGGFYQLNLGERLLDAGNVDEAILQLQRSVKDMPQKLTPHVRLGYAYLLRGDADAALATLTAAEKLKPSEREIERGVDALLRADLARAHAAKGNAREAVKHLQAMKKAGQLEAEDLKAAEFNAIREDAAFKAIKP